MRRLNLVIPVAAALLAPVALSSQPSARSARPAAITAPVILDTTGMFQAKYARVGTDFYIGGQPTPRALRELKAAGVTTVVNLRMPDEMRRIGFDEAALLAELGIRYVHIPVRAGTENPYSPDALVKFTEAMKSADGKVLLHCTIAWRASHLWAAYLIAEHGMSEVDALAHARAINLMDEHRMGPGDRQPVEEFLNRKLPTIGRPQR